MMTARLSRRQMVAGLSVAAIAAASGVVPARPIAPPVALAHRTSALVLHDGSNAGRAFVQQLKFANASTKVRDLRAVLLQREGIALVRAALDTAHGLRLIALIDDAEAVVLEMMLKARGYHAIVHARHEGHALLSAQL